MHWPIKTQTPLRWTGDDNLAATQLATTGVRVSTTLGGATVALGYAKNDNGGSTGIEVSYPMGALTTTASYVQEGAASAENKWDVKVAYAEGALGVTVAYRRKSGLEC
jgi:hypothetical protein